MLCADFKIFFADVLTFVYKMSSAVNVRALCSLFEDTSDEGDHRVSELPHAQNNKRKNKLCNRSSSDIGALQQSDNNNNETLVRINVPVPAPRRKASTTPVGSDVNLFRIHQHAEFSVPLTDDMHYRDSLSSSMPDIPASYHNGTDDVTRNFMNDETVGDSENLPELPPRAPRFRSCITDIINDVSCQQKTQKQYTVSSYKLFFYADIYLAP